MTMNQTWSALLSFLTRGRKRDGHGFARRRRPTGRMRLTPERLEDRTVPSISGSAFYGLAYDSSQGATPPDTIVAAGPNHVVEAVNDNLFFGSKATLPNSLSGTVQSFDSFFPGFTHSIFGLDDVISDPSVNYDAATGKWIISILDIDLQNDKGYLNIAVSNTNDPTGSWTKFQLDLTDGHGPLIPGNAGLTLWGDFDRFGSSADAYVWTVKMFSFSSGGIDQNSLFDHVQVIAVDKSNLSNVNTVDLPSWDSTTSTITNENLLPVRMDGPTAADGMWFAEETNYGTSSGQASALRLVHVADMLTATSSDFKNYTGNVPLYQFTFVPDSSTGGNHPWNNGDTNNNALQAGSSAYPNPGLIDTNDTRIDSAVWRTVNGQQHLVLTQTVEDPADPTTAKARWYDFNTTGANNPSVAVPLYQSGEINPGAGVFTYFPSAAIDPAGDIGMTYLESAANELLTMYVTGKALNESGMETGAAVINDSPDAGPDGSPHRAGDYSGTVVDINSAGAPTNSFWSANEYASSGVWATVLDNFSISNPVPPPVIGSVTADGQNPDTVTGKTALLGVTASDPSGYSLSYSWSVKSGPSGVTFTNNTVTSTGDTVTANFTQAGSYTFQVTVTDSQGASSTATVAVTVNQTLTSIVVSPASATVADGTTKQFSATAYDQFGSALTTQRTFTWSLASGGTNIDPNTGLYTAPLSGAGSDTVQATAGNVTGPAGVTYAQPPTITATSANPSSVTGKTTTLSVTASDPNPGGTITGYAWSLVSGPAGVTFGSSTASSTTVNFAKAGTYQFQVTVTNSYGLSSTGTVTVTVQQTLTRISLSPSSVTLKDGQTQTFTATAYDQFGNAMTTQPTFTWTWSGIGTFKQTSNTTLQYTAPSNGTGTATITVSVSGTSFTSSATITVTRKRH
jgi:hypothetical protein